MLHTQRLMEYAQQKDKAQFLDDAKDEAEAHAGMWLVYPTLPAVCPSCCINLWYAASCA